MRWHVGLMSPVEREVNAMQLREGFCHRCTHTDTAWDVPYCTKGAKWPRKGICAQFVAKNQEGEERR